MKELEEQGKIIWIIWIVLIVKKSILLILKLVNFYCVYIVLKLNAYFNKPNT